MSKESEIKALVEHAIETGRKLEKAKGLTTNQGGIPHPELYEENMVKMLVKKHMTLAGKTNG